MRGNKHSSLFVRGVCVTKTKRCYSLKRQIARHANNTYQNNLSNFKKKKKLLFHVENTSERDRLGAMTFSKTTFIVMALGITVKNATLSMNDTQNNSIVWHFAEYSDSSHNADCRYAKCRGATGLGVRPCPYQACSSLTRKF
jgi:hypothetical protein